MVELDCYEELSQKRCLELNSDNLRETTVESFMKKIVSAAGMAALGVVGLHAAAGDGLTRMETSKPWSLKANLRGFYDDNVFTTPDLSLIHI